MLIQNQSLKVLDGVIHPDYPGEPRFYVNLLKGKKSNDERHIILKNITKNYLKKN